MLLSSILRHISLYLTDPDKVDMLFCSFFYNFRTRYALQVENNTHYSGLKQKNNSKMYLTQSSWDTKRYRDLLFQHKGQVFQNLFNIYGVDFKARIFKNPLCVFLLSAGDEKECGTLSPLDAPATGTVKCPPAQERPGLSLGSWGEECQVGFLLTSLNVTSPPGLPLLAQIGQMTPSLDHTVLR